VGKFESGHAKKGGKVKGTPNKVTTEIREFYKSILDKNQDKFESAMNSIFQDDKAEYVRLSLMISERFVPKISAQSIDVTSGGKTVVFKRA
jgi:hypothetical protein